MKRTLLDADFEYFYQNILSSQSNFNEKKLFDIVMGNSSLKRFIPLITLDDENKERMPKSVLKEYYKVKLGINLANKKKERFINIIDIILKEQEIDIILLKSSALNGYIYDYERARDCSDIDLLVHPSNYDRLTQSIKKISYLYTTEKTEPFDGKYEETWISKIDKTVIFDIHRNLNNPTLYNINLEEIFSNSKIHPYYKSENIRCMSPEHNLIHLGIHVIHDGYLQHHSLIDAKALYETECVDKKQLFATARSWHAEYSTLLLISILYELNNSRKELYTNSYTFNLRYKFSKLVLKKKFKEKTILRRIQQIAIHILMIDNIASVAKHYLTYIKLKLRYALFD